MLSLALIELTLRDVLADIPHDAGAVVVYVLLATLSALVWYGSRRSAGAPPADPPGGSADAAPEAADVRPRRDAAADPVTIHTDTLASVPDVRRAHPEVR